MPFEMPEVRPWKVSAEEALALFVWVEDLPALLLLEPLLHLRPPIAALIGCVFHPARKIYSLLALHVRPTRV
jgi:hypothetical protein